jgi:hypothetical protein
MLRAVSGRGILLVLGLLGAVALPSAAMGQPFESRGALTVYDKGRHVTWFKDANAPESLGVIGMDDATQSAIATPPHGLLTKDEALGFAVYVNQLSFVPGREWSLPGDNEACADPDAFSDLFTALGNNPATVAPTQSYSVHVTVRTDDYMAGGQGVNWQSPTEYRATATYAEIETMLLDPEVVWVDADLEPFLVNRGPFLDLSSSAPYWMKEDVPADPSRSKIFDFFRGRAGTSPRDLRRYVLLMHEGDVHQTGPADAIPADADADGIADAIDSDAAVASNDFSDVALGGTSSGTLLDRGGQRLSLWAAGAGAGRRIVIRSAAIPLGAVFANPPVGLQRRGPRVVYDADQDLTWSRDANLARTIDYNSAASTSFAGGRLNFDEAAGCGEELGYGPCTIPPATLAGFDHFIDYLNDGNALQCGDRGWRLPRPDPTNCGEIFGCTTSEMGYLYHVLLANPVGTPGGGPVLDNRGPFLNVELGTYWTGQDLFSPTSDLRFTFNFAHGLIEAIDRRSPSYVWAVHDGDVAGPSPARVGICGGIAEITITRWEKASFFCESAHVEALQGRPLVVLRAGGQEAARLRLPQGQALAYDESTGTLAAGAANTLPLVVKLPNGQLSIAAGETKSLAAVAAPSGRPWLLLVLFVLLAGLVIGIVWLHESNSALP